jgi:hypothetical protein
VPGNHLESLLLPRHTSATSHRIQQIPDMIHPTKNAFVWLLLMVPAAQGAEWIVPDQHATIQAALDVAVHGDVIYVHPGVYRESLTFQGKDVALRSLEGPVGTILDAERRQGIEIGPGGAVEGFTIRNASASFGAAMSVSGDGTVVRGNIFAGNNQGAGGFGAAIGGNSASPIIEQNLFRENSADEQHLSGVVCFVNSSSPRIANNVFVSNSTRAINLTLPQGNAPVVINNTIVGNTVGIRVDGRVSTDRHVYRNNILANNQVGLDLPFAFEDPQMLWEHNLVFGGQTLYGGMEDPTGQQGNLSADPLFWNAPAGDFRLLPDSPAIDAGTPTGAPATDFLHRSRAIDGNLDGVAQVDMGALEFFPEPPLPPSKLLGASGEQQVSLNWQGWPDADNYEVKRATVSGGPYAAIQIVTEPGFVDEAVSDGIAYFYVVTASNRFGESAPSAEVMVVPGNRPPVAVDDEATTPEDTPVVIDVLGNDSDPDGDDIVLLGVGVPQNGAVQIHVDGTITYTPAPNFHGTDEFSYWIADAGGRESSAQVRITITPVNDPPVALGQFRSFIGDASLSIKLEGSDIDGDPLTFLLLQSPQHGVISGFDALTGTLTYTPAHAFSGTDSFTFLASDGLTNSVAATVQLAVALPRDVDGNGIPDYWEVKHDIKNRNEDRDHDGMTNYQEYIANTDPRDEKSVLRIQSVERNLNGHYIVTWASAGGVRYRVQSSDSLQGPFVDIPRLVLEELDPHPAGTPSIMSYTDDFSQTVGPPLSGMRYYRVRVVR